MSKDNKPSKTKISPWLIYGGILLIFLAIQLVAGGSAWQDPKSTSLSNFYKYLDSGEVDKVVFNKSTAKVFLKKEALLPKMPKSSLEPLLGLAKGLF